MYALHDASRKGDAVSVRFLLTGGATVDARDAERRTPLDIACEGTTQCHCSVVRLLLNEGADVNSRNGSNLTTPLFAAARSGSVETVNLLLSKGAKVNVKDKLGGYVLFDACRLGHTGVVASLIKAGADVNARGAVRDTPLFPASQNGHVEIVKLLLASGADPKAAGHWQETPLFSAADGGHPAVALLLIRAGADLNASDNRGKTALYWACKNGHESVAKLLLEEGCRSNPVDIRKQSPLHAAAMTGRYQIVDTLIRAGAELNGADSNGRTPIFFAAKNGHGEVVKLMLLKGAAATVKDRDGHTALSISAQNGEAVSVRLLVFDAADKDRLAAALSDTDSVDGRSAMLWASYNGHAHVVSILCEAGSDINAIGKDGKSAIHLACCNGHHEVVRVLLKSGAGRELGLYDDLSQKKEWKSEGPSTSNAKANIFSILFDATNNGHVEVVRVLLDAGMKPNVHDENGMSPIIYASTAGRTDMVTLFLDHGTAPNMETGSEKTTPLICAADSGHLEVVKVLLQYGASPHSTDIWEKSALHRASERGHEAVVKYLLDHGAVVHTKDRDGATPMICAAMHGHRNIVSLLRRYCHDHEHGAKSPPGSAALSASVFGKVARFSHKIVTTISPADSNRHQESPTLEPSPEDGPNLRTISPADGGSDVDDSKVEPASTRLLASSGSGVGRRLSGVSRRSWREKLSRGMSTKNLNSFDEDDREEASELITDASVNAILTELEQQRTVSESINEAIKNLETKLVFMGPSEPIRSIGTPTSSVHSLNIASPVAVKAGDANANVLEGNGDENTSLSAIVDDKLVDMAGIRFKWSSIIDATGRFADANRLAGDGNYRGELFGMKVMIRAVDVSSSSVSEFVRNINIHGRYRHRHIIPFIGWGQKNETIKCAVYSYPTGGSLSERLGRPMAQSLASSGVWKHEPLRWRERLNVAVGISRGIAFLHYGSGQPLVHRNLTSDNVFIDDVGYAWIANFGLSKPPDSKAELVVKSDSHSDSVFTKVSSWHLEGSFGYIDPEYSRTGVIDERSDVFAFGVLVLEMITGQSAVSKTHVPRDLVSRIRPLLSQPSAIIEMADSRAGTWDMIVLTELIHLASRCLAENSKDRPDSAELLRHLEMLSRTS